MYLQTICFSKNPRVFPQNTHHPSIAPFFKNRQIATCFFFSEWNAIANKMTMASTSVSQQENWPSFVGPSDHKRYPPGSDD